MTVLSKSGASTDSPAGDTSSNYPRDDKRPYPNEPPSYTDSVGSHNIQSGTATSAATSASNSAAASLPHPTNCRNESRSNESIKGTWVVDTNIDVPPPPPTFWSSLGWAEKERPNLALSTSNGTVNANVVLVSGSSKRAFIKATTHNGPVTVKITSRFNDQPVKILATTGHGAIKIGLPRSFVGPFKFQTSWGHIEYSDDLRLKTNTYSANTGFIGDWRTVGFVDHKTWQGDMLEVSTSWGQISFYYADEMPEDTESESDGFWNTVKDWIGAR